MALKTLDEYLESVKSPQARTRMAEVVAWVQSEFPELELRIAWNQPMFTDHGTFIIGFSAASKHLSIAPERATMLYFAERFTQLGVDHGKMLVRQPLAQPFNYELLRELIEFQIADKRDCTSFWRAQAEK